MESILSKLIHRRAVSGTGQRKGARPPAAVELASDGVVAATGSPASFSFAPLPPGALVPGVAEANLRAPAAVADAIRQALDAVRPFKRAVSLIVPDLASRVFVLDFDALPAKPAEAVPILRFRLRKMVPFDVDRAGLGYQILSVGKNSCKVLAAVTPATVLAEYEAAVRTAGYEPGALLPAALVALETLASGEDDTALFAHLSPESMTTAITRGDDLLLYRTLVLPTDEATRTSEIQRSVAVAAAFFEDSTGAAPTRIHFAGGIDAATFAQLAGAPELEVVELAPHPETGAATSLGTASLAAVTGALTGVGL